MKTISSFGLLAATLLASTAWAQLPPVVVSSQAYAPLNGAAIGVPVGRSSFFDPADEGSVAIPLPFSFTFLGQSYTQVFADTNGFLSLGAACTSSCLSPTGFPDASAPNAIVAGFWDDMELDATSSIRYVAGPGELTVEWASLPQYGSSSRVTFQIKLSASGTVTVHYGPIVGAGFVASAGYENASGTIGANLLTGCTDDCDAANYVPNRVFTIGEPVEADLAVSSVTTANLLQASDGNMSFDFTAGIRNFGRTNAVGFGWKAYLSRDQRLDLNLTDGGLDDLQVAQGGPLGLDGVDGGVAPDGGSSLASISGSVTTVTALPTGEYYLLVEADPANAVAEAAEANNVGSASTPIVQGIDLAANSIAAPSTATEGGAIASFPLSFVNRGGVDAGTVGFRVLLSLDETLDPGDYVAFTGAREVGPSQAITEAVPVVMPASSPAGEFFAILQLDPAATVTEANEQNNWVASTGKVEVRRPDLVAEASALLDTVTLLETSTGRFGEAVLFRVRFRNGGAAPAGAFRVALVLSSDSSLSLLSDSYVCDATVASVAANAPSQDVTLSCSLPLTGVGNVPFPTGQYFLFGVVDSTGAVFESNKSNNSFLLGPVKLSAPGPDLAVTTVTAPASAGVGEVVPVVRTLRNLGNVDGPAVAYRYYASANDIITADDVPLEIIGNGGAQAQGLVTLARGAGDTLTELVRLPVSLPPGTYHVGCIIDGARVVTNDLEPENNAGASRGMLVAPSALRIVTSALPDAVIGRPFTYRLAAMGEQGASSWRIDSTLGGASPSWLSLNATDGLLSGTPPGDAGTGPVAVTIVLENAGRQAIARLALRVLTSSPAVQVVTTSLPAVVNALTSQYQFSLGASGGVRPYAWRLANGALPGGLSLSAEGVLSGSPRGATNGAAPLTFEVRDAVGSRAERVLSLRVIPPGAIMIRTISVPDALVGQEYLQDIAVANQDNSALAKPLRWTVTGTLPAGITATPASELITISGRATEAGTFRFSISVEDNNGRTDTLEFTMTVHPPRFRVLGALPDVLRPGAAVSVPLSVSPHSDAVSYRLVSGALPPGLTLDAAGLLSGTVATDDSEGLWSFVVEASDDQGMSGLTAFTLTVERQARAGCSSTAADTAPWMMLALAGLAFGRPRRRAAPAVLGLTLVAALAPMTAGAQQYQVTPAVAAAYQPLTNGAVTTAGSSIPLPFSMPFFDTQVTSVAMSQHGYLAVGGSTATDLSNLGVPHSSTSSSDPRSFIAPWWDQLATPLTPSAGYRYLVSGTSPNRVMSFEWNGTASSTSTTSRTSFQVQLHETTGRIRFVYASTAPGSGSASVGIQKDVAVGFAGLTCATSASCSSLDFPSGRAIDFFLPPDLEIIALSAPQAGYAGVPFPQTATIRNRGGREATNVTVRFFLSTDATLQMSTDTIIGSTTVASIDAQATAQATLNAPLPATLSQSSYFVFAVVDPDATVVEQSDNNNQSAPSVVAIGAPTPDLVVSAFSAPTTAMPGASLTVQRSLQNIGNAVSSAAKYTYFLSDNASVSIADRAMTVGTLGALNAQQVDVGTDSIMIPADLSPGIYWLGLCVNFDAASSTFGGNEITIVNNCFTQNAGVQVSTGAVAVVATPLPAATQYAPYGVRLQATGGTGTYAWELVSGSLPPGMTLSAAGDLVGSPSTAGAFSFDVKVTSGALNDTKPLSLQVTAGGLPLVIVDQSLTAAEFGRVYTASLVAVGGKPPYSWRALAPEELPPGIGIATDGLVEGRPVSAGDFAFGVEVKDSTGAAVSKELSVRVVTPTSLSIATSALETAVVGRSYLQPLVAIGGKAPYAWSLIRFQELPENLTDVPGAVVENGGLPVQFPADFGIAIEDTDAADFLSGTPRRAGLYALTLKVKDGAETEDTASVLLHVSYRDGLAITTLQLPDAFVNQPYQVRLSHNGGSDAVGITFSTPCVQQAVRPGEFRCVDQAALEKLPAGLSLSAEGTVLGTPLADTGTYTFLVKVSDALGRQDVRALAIRLRPDFAQSGSGCTTVGLEPSLLALALAGFALRRRRR